MARKTRELELKKSVKVEKKKEKVFKEPFLKNSKREFKNISLDNKIKIFCNASETEPNYFENFKNDFKKSKIVDLEIEIIKRGGKSPLDIVKYAIINGGSAQEIWVVFDKDHYDIECAIELAKKNAIKIAWSNESFELWFLLHFNLVTTSMDRKVCLNKVIDAFKNTFKKNYAKNNTESYELLKPYMKIAISRAKKIHQEAELDGKRPSNSNPCTTVYKLVESLLKKRSNLP